ncbi:class I SAM-dependent methyltransferase [Akkermansiaceae bacterium]|nr:class I SAM-dependent methyltransferase [Akkermansiaceae bacterium]
MEKYKIIQKLHMLKYRGLIAKLVERDSNVLDIGFGFGYLKPLVESRGANYSGVDPRRDGAVEYAKENYGEEGFVQGYFPEAKPLTKEELKDGVILALTSLDEVVDQDSFLTEICNLCSEKTRVYIAVRNSGWLLFRKRKLVTIDGYEIRDYSLEDYFRKFERNGFEVLKIEKSSRPILTSVTLKEFKNFIIVLIDLLLPTKKSYMLGFLLKKLS